MECQKCKKFMNKGYFSFATSRHIETKTIPKVIYVCKNCYKDGINILYNWLNNEVN